MRTVRLVAAVLAATFAAIAPVAAHHSFAAEFDGSKPVTLRGTITKMEWTNPHAWLHVDVKGTDGTVVDRRWRAQRVASARLEQRVCRARYGDRRAGVSRARRFQPGEWR